MVKAMWFAPEFGGIQWSCSGVRPPTAWSSMLCWLRIAWRRNSASVVIALPSSLRRPRLLQLLHQVGGHVVAVERGDQVDALHPAPRRRDGLAGDGGALRDAVLTCLAHALP